MGNRSVRCASLLQCVAVCCSVLQRETVWNMFAYMRRNFIVLMGNRSVLQCVAVCCSVLQCVAVCCSVHKCMYMYVCTCSGAIAASVA